MCKTKSKYECKDISKNIDLKSIDLKINKYIYIDIYIDKNI